MYQRKSTRLKEYDYSQPGAYFVTICCRDKIPVFRNRKFTDLVWTYLNSQFAGNGGDIAAAVVLPDHIHLIIEFSEGNTKTLGERVRELKIATWLALRDAHWSGERLWQRNYYEHVIRNEKDWNEKANYIWGNPVKSGLVDEPEEWPFLWVKGLDKSALRGRYK